MSSIKVNATIFVGGGNLLKVTHDSKVLGLPANFNIFLPPVALGKSPQKVPVLFYLCMDPYHPLSAAVVHVSVLMSSVIAALCAVLLWMG